MSLNSGLWSNFLRKTAIIAAYYFPAKEESVFIRKKQGSVNSTGHDLDARQARYDEETIVIE